MVLLFITSLQKRTVRQREIVFPKVRQLGSGKRRDLNSGGRLYCLSQDSCSRGIRQCWSTLCLPVSGDVSIYFPPQGYSVPPKMGQGREWRGGAFAELGRVLQETEDMGDTIIYEQP